MSSTALFNNHCSWATFSNQKNHIFSVANQQEEGLNFGSKHMDLLKRNKPVLYHDS